MAVNSLSPTRARLFIRPSANESDPRPNALLKKTAFRHTAAKLFRRFCRINTSSSRDGHWRGHSVTIGRLLIRSRRWRK
ncbi:hypothetical protein TNCV_1166661 [Trichonephila clavipes]|uniref:Uncharacterized protein n=1 Tax=Trichonephila clavipes TaxID=2585209 RepID=A0A8X6VSP7_TRICX|nr:hypothetical protein TNCV_1166661 [Trichonephila clavipes]